jgi:hypothetical protein
LAYQSYQGIETPEIRAWKRRNADATPQWMVKIAQDMPESTLPVMMLPGLVGRAGVELFYETVQLAGDVVKFNINEIERFTKGQETLTVKAIMLMSKFVGEEAARIAAKEDPASFEIAKNLALNFNHLEMEDQVKAGAKLALSLFATPTGIARVAKVSGENAEKALQLVAQVEKVTALPAAPLRINPPRAAKQWPSQPLMFSVEAKVSAQGGLARAEYSAANVKATSITEDGVSKIRYKNIANGVTKAEARAMLKNDTFGLTNNQVKTIFKCFGDGRVDKVNIKVDNYGMVRLSMERLGHTSGFQRMSYKINQDGVKTSVVQTAYDNQKKLVRQKPGNNKNNLYDVKKYVSKK